MPEPEDFFALDIRAGTVVHAEPFAGARKPAIKLWIDFGELGVKQSSAQLTHHYSADDMLGRQVAAVVNIGERRIAGWKSEVLVLGGMPEPHEVVLLQFERPVANGTRIG